jgi:SAM-dependent methyltransferase
MSPGWEAWQDEFESSAAPVTATLLELGGVRPGQSVLDIATGQGEPALSAARIVGPTARVVGIDASAGMLEVARRRADGLANVEFVQAALAERLEMPPPPAGLPGPFSMSDPEQLGQELTAAGFADVSVAEHVVPFRFRSIDHYLRFNRALLPPRMLTMVRDRFGSEDDLDTWAAVARAVERHVDGDGRLALPSTALCVRAVTSSDSR